MQLVTIAGTAVGVVGLILTWVTLALSPRKGNETPPVRKRLPTIRLWRPAQFSLAFSYLSDYCENLKNAKYDSRRGFVSSSDLVRWTISQALTCAATLVPQSLGKATLFRVSTIRSYGKDDPWQPFRREIRIYTSDFVGVFSPSQLSEPRNPNRIRTFLMGGPNQSDSEVPVALKCLRGHEPTMERLPRLSNFDSPELAVGTTHVLAIPLCSSANDVKREDQPVAITVDLRFSWFRYWLMRLPFRDPHKHPTYSRAYKLMRLLEDVMPAWEAAEREMSHRHGLHIHVGSPELYARSFERPEPMGPNRLRRFWQRWRTARQTRADLVATQPSASWNGAVPGTVDGKPEADGAVITTVNVPAQKRATTNGTDTTSVKET